MASSMWKILCFPCMLIICELCLGEGDIKSLVAKIQSLEDLLYDTMVKLPAGQGQKFLQDVKQFNSHMRQLMNIVETNGINETKSILDTLIDRGHPKFLDTPFNNEEKKRILYNFNWTLDDLDLLYEYRVTAYTYWTDLLLLKNDNYEFKS